MLCRARHRRGRHPDDRHRGGAGLRRQVIVLHDLLGLAGPNVPKFVRRYAELGRTATEAVRDWAADVRAGTYPSEAESYHASAELREALGLSS